MKNENEMLVENEPATIERIKLGNIPAVVATRLLTEPKNRLTNKSRKRFHLSRSHAIEMDNQEPKLEQETYCAMLKRLSLRQLGRRLTQAVNRRRRAESVMSKLPEGSRFRRPLEETITLQRYRQGWVLDEVAGRTAKCEAVAESQATWAAVAKMS